MSEAADPPCPRRKVVVACLGNADRGDDGIGPMVAQTLFGRLPADVALLVRGGDMLSLIEDWRGCDALVCVDAAAPMGVPGRIHRIDLATDELPPNVSVMSSHAFSLAEAVRLARILGCAPQNIIVYAVEGSCFAAGAAMSAALAAAASEVASRVFVEIGVLLNDRRRSAPDARQVVLRAACRSA